MQAGRRANIDKRMRGGYNIESKLTDSYLPRKCDYTDRLLTSKDHSSVQLSICDVNPDGTINRDKTTLVTISGFVRSSGQGDTAVQKVLREKKII